MIAENKIKKLKQMLIMSKTEHEFDRFKSGR